jgi:hypothetical protein
MRRSYDPDGRYLSYARGDVAYAWWVHCVDKLCQRFLGTPFFEVEDLLHASDSHALGLSPGEFFADVIIETVEYELGVMDVAELVFNRAMWGERGMR